MDKNKQKTLLPVLFSLPTVNTLDLPPRAEILPKIESGEIDHLDFRAQVFSQTSQNRNPYRFKDEDMKKFADSFEGQPYLRDHDTFSIDSRDGTLVSSELKDGWVVVDVRLTTRRGMIDYIEGKMDRFSIGWFYEDAHCSICDASFFSRDCNHWPGLKYKVGTEMKQCILTFINPQGKELSAVNVPAMVGTGITGALMEAKLSCLEEVSFDGGISPSEGESSKLTVEQEREVEALRERVSKLLRKE
jgi:hypothetical protein